MHPILLSIGGFTVYSYGFFVAIGFVSAVLYMSYALKKSKYKIISQDQLYSLAIYLIIAAVIGARVLYELVENFSGFIANPFDIFKVWQGGLVFYGGLITAVATFVFFAVKKKKNVLKLADLFAPAIALGHFFGRIGCFFAGCCYGKDCALPWSVEFNNPDTLAVKGVHIHPTQLYEAFGNLIIFFILALYNKNRNKHKAGNTLALYFLGYGILRFTVEFFRADYRGGEFLGLSVSQVFSIILFAIGCIMLTNEQITVKVKKIRKRKK